MLAVAGIAAYLSYWHAYAVVRAHGESGITARLGAATIDGLVYASTVVVLYAATPASAQHGDGVPKADADNFAAVAAYRLSARAGNPLSERKLAQMFGRTSRRWARARIAEARQSP